MAAVTLLLLSWVGIFSIFQCPVYAQDPCTSYSVLNDESRSVLKTSSSNTRDYYISGWYRFMGKAGDKMLDYPPTYGPGYRCNTYLPGYLSGQHPRGSDGVVSRTVCFASSGSKCWTSTTIQVKNCGNYFVYKLNRLTSSYYMRYCGSGEVGKQTIQIHKCLPYVLFYPRWFIDLKLAGIGRSVETGEGKEHCLLTFSESSMLRYFYLSLTPTLLFRPLLFESHFEAPDWSFVKSGHQSFAKA